MKSRISYKSGYKYQLIETYTVKVPIVIAADINTDYITLTTDGWLTIKRGYAWDGPSGPTFDTKSFMRGALVHDALYQLLRLGRLHPVFRELADQILYNICREDGMSFVRANLVYQAVSRFAAPCADHMHEKPVEYAPDIPTGESP